jgi:hypothetical protein
MHKYPPNFRLSRSGNASVALGSFEEVFLENNVVVEPDNWTGSPPLGLGFYSLQISSWLHYYDLGSKMLVITNEELTTDPGAVMAKVQLFLGLEPIITDGNFYFDNGKGFYCYITSKPVPRKVCLPPSKGRVPPNIPSHVLAKVKQFYAAHMRDLQMKVPTIKTYWS